MIFLVALQILNPFAISFRMLTMTCRSEWANCNIQSIAKTNVYLAASWEETTGASNCNGTTLSIYMTGSLAQSSLVVDYNVASFLDVFHSEHRLRSFTRITNFHRDMLLSMVFMGVAWTVYGHGG